MVDDGDVALKSHESFGVIHNSSFFFLLSLAIPVSGDDLDETNIHVTSAALNIAPRYGRPVSWKNHVEIGVIIASTPMMWKRFIVKEASAPPGPDERDDAHGQQEARTVRA